MRSWPAQAPAWFVAIVLLGLTALVSWPLAASPTSSLPGDYGDPVFVSWAMGWVAGTLTEALQQPSALGGLWNANIFFPESQTLAFSEHFIGQTLTVLPIYWVTGNLILAYNVAFGATFILTGLGTFLLARALTGSATGACFAAVVAAFNEYRLVYEISHLHVLSIHWLPFALFGIHRYLETDRRRDLVYFAAAAIGLNLSSMYYMVYYAPFVAVFALCEMVYWRRWRRPRVWIELWAALAFIAAVTLPFLLPYVEVQQRLGVERSLDEVMRFSATLDHYFVALPGLVPAIAFALVAIFGMAVDRTRRTRWTTGVCVVLMLLAFWLSLGPVVQQAGRALTVPGLYGFLYDLIPGYRGLRVPARFAALMFVFLGLLASAGVRVLESRAVAVARAMAIIATVVFLVRATPDAFPINRTLPSEALAPPPAYLTPAAQPPPIYQQVDSLRPGAILVEFPFGDSWYELRYMFFAATHRRRLLNGYSGIFPPSYLARQRILARPTLDPERAAAAISVATHIVVHRQAWKDDTGALIGAWLETLGARLIADSTGAALYEMPSREELAQNKKAGRTTQPFLRNPENGRFTPAP